MAFKEYRRPTESEWNVDEVAAYLKERGFLLGPGGIGAGVESTDEGMSVLVRLDVDANLPDDILTAALDSYQPPDNPTLAARGRLMKRIKEIRGVPEKKRSQADQDLLDVAVVLGMEV